MTRKIHSLSVVFPKYIREQNIVYQMLKLEQEGERIHKELNQLEQSLGNIRNKPFRYYHLLKKYYIKLNLPLDIFKVQKKVKKNQRKTDLSSKVKAKFSWKK